MAINDSLIYAIPQELVGKASALITILQALGGIIVLYVIFNIINMFLNRKKHKEMQLINKNLEKIKILLSKKSIN